MLLKGAVNGPPSAVTGENERTENRMDDLAKPDEQLNDQVESSFVCIHKCSKGLTDSLIL